MMAFRIAWFKVHEPLAFYAAYFYRRSQKGGFDEGMMCHGIEQEKAAGDQGGRGFQRQGRRSVHDA